MTNSSSFRFLRSPFLVVAAAIFIYFFPVILLKEAFLSGDHWEQQYPWAALLQETLKAGELPWWTSRIGCGFPILAEGQIGAFYPLNWIFYLLLPLKTAYSGITLFHYFIGAFLFYHFIRKLGVSAWAGVFASLIYVFGSTQCGYFYYNFISQKTVIWLPLSLLMLDRLRRGGGFGDACALAVTLILAMFGGYIQIALYVWLFVFLYFIYFFIQSPSKRFFGWSFFAAAVTIGISMLQIIPTAELAGLTSRGEMGKEFAYVGSMNPLGFLTLVHPSWDGWLRSELYVSLAGLFFIFFSFFKFKDAHQKFFAAAAVLFLLLALGKFSPLYRAIIELTHFSGFRTPIKFLFFAGFSLAILAGYGWDRFFASEVRSRFKTWIVFCSIITPSILIPLAGPSIMRALRSTGVEAFQNYVKTSIFNRPGHPHSMDFYLNKAVEYYDSVTRMIDCHLPQNFWQIILAMVTLCLTGLAVRRQTHGNHVKTVCMLLLIADLFFYGTTSIRANFESYTHVSSPGLSAPGVSLGFERNPAYRFADYYLPDEELRDYPLFPSQNMVYGQDHLGIYTPLVLSGWKQTMQGMAYLNDSIQAQFVDPSVFAKRIGELSILNIQYLVSKSPLSLTGWTERQPAPLYIYENTAVQPRYFFYAGDLPGSLPEVDAQKIKPTGELDLQQLKVTAAGRSDEAGWLVGTDVHYPGWQAVLNGQTVPVEKFAGLFRAVRVVSAGDYRLELAYKPRIKEWSPYILGAWILIFIFATFHLTVWPFMNRKCS